VSDRIERFYAVAMKVARSQNIRRDQRAARANEPHAALVADLERATAQHDPGKKFLRCEGCGGLAFALFHDAELGMAGAQCIVCGAIHRDTFRLS
jgi:hypothetical protein